MNDKDFCKGIDGPQYFDFNADMDSEDFSESYFDIDHETGLSVNKMANLDASSGNLWFDAEGNLTPEFSTPNRSLIFSKSRKSAKKNKIFMDAIPDHVYDLRETPSRLSHLSNLLQTDTQACAKASMKIPMSPAYMLRSKTPSSDRKRHFPIQPNLNTSAFKVRHSIFKEDGTVDCHDENANPNVLRKSRVTFTTEIELPEGCPSDVEIIAPAVKTLIRKSTPSQGRWLKQNNNLSNILEPQSPLVSRKLELSKQKTEKSLIPAAKVPAINLDTSRNSKRQAISTFHPPSAKKQKPNEPYKEVDFVHMLRRTSPRIATKKMQLTKTKPFNLTRGGNRKIDELATNKKKTMAEQVRLFHKGTPQRFRSVKPGTAFQPQGRGQSPQLVRPKSPKLKATTRHRPVTALSRHEIEEKEIKEMTSYKFQARPFNKHIVSSPDLVKPKHKEPTKPVDINFRTEKRLAARQKSEENEVYVFKAQEVPASVFKAPKDVRAKRSIRCTAPESPAFVLKKRAAHWDANKPSTSVEENVMFKALPPPKFDSPFTVKHVKKCTTTQPFSFDPLDKERYALKEKKIQEEIENESKVPEFHAHPLPPSVLTPRPMRTHSAQKKTTIPEPFNLHFADETQKLRKIQMIEQEEAAMLRSHFKAQPATVVKKKPFVPKSIPHEPIDILEPCLRTEERAAKRIKDIEDRAPHDAEMAALAQERQAAKEKEEKEAIRQLRSQRVHKANPVRHYNGVEVQPSSKPLTLPQSPDFKTTSRLRTTLLD